MLVLLVEITVTNNNDIKNVKDEKNAITRVTTNANVANRSVKRYNRIDNIVIQGKDIISLVILENDEIPKTEEIINFYTVRRNVVNNLLSILVIDINGIGL